MAQVWNWTWLTVAFASEVAVFGAGVLALTATGHPRLAVALAAAALLSSVLSTPPAPH
jgi:hypothetical protein